ncbi:MAG: hypothetical protein GY851_33905 [bacterium]|nr:hypothetical protein [bacterium]
MQRPTSVTVFGVLNIIFGVLGLTCTPLGTLYVVFLPKIREFYEQQGVQLPEMPMLESPGYRMFLIISMVIGVVASGALLASGIGLFKLRPWARTTSIVYSVYAILAFIVGQVIAYAIVWQPTLDAIDSAEGPMQSGMAGGFAGGICGGVVGMAHPVLLLIFMLLPTVKKAFYPTQPPTLPGEWGQE